MPLGIPLQKQIVPARIGVLGFFVRLPRLFVYPRPVVSLQSVRFLRTAAVVGVIVHFPEMPCFHQFVVPVRRPVQRVGVVADANQYPRRTRLPFLFVKIAFVAYVPHFALGIVQIKAEVGKLVFVAGFGIFVAAVFV